MNQLQRFWRLTLIGLTVTLSMQVFRALFPLVLYQPGLRLGQTSGQNVAANLAAVFALAAFTPFIARWLGAGRGFGLAAALLALARLALQLTPPTEASILPATLAAAIAIIALPLGILWIYAAEGTGRRFAQGMIVGLALDAALNSASLTWDMIWRRDIIALIAAAVLSGILLLALWQERRTLLERYTMRMPLLPLLTTGLYLFLQVLFLQNPAFVASFTHFSLPAASGLILVGDALALWLAERWTGYPRLAIFATGIGLIVALAQLHSVTEVVAATVIVVSQVLASGLLAVVFGPRPAVSRLSPLSIARLLLSAAMVGLLFAGLMGLYYVPNGINVLYSATAVPVAAAVALTLAALIARREQAAADSDKRIPIGAVAAILGMLLVPVGLWLTQPALPTQTTRPFRLMTYNVHQGFDLNGWLGMEAIAAEIKSQQPDIVVLEEVSRGMFPDGSVEMAEWFSRRLNMAYRFAPASDEQFGDAILTRLPILDSDAGLLPRGRAPQNRGYIRVRLDVGTGEPVTVIGTHLNDFGTDIRIPQAQRLVELWGQSPRTILTGDMNTHPGTPDIAVFFQAGLISAQDVTGNEDQMTFISDNPYARIDWIFGSPDAQFSNFAIPRTTASDHLPVLVTVGFSD